MCRLFAGELIRSAVESTCGFKRLAILEQHRSEGRVRLPGERTIAGSSCTLEKVPCGRGVIQFGRGKTGNIGGLGAIIRTAGEARCLGMFQCGVIMPSVVLLERIIQAMGG